MFYYSLKVLRKQIAEDGIDETSERPPRRASNESIRMLLANCTACQISEDESPIAFMVDISSNACIMGLVSQTPLSKTDSLIKEASELLDVADIDYTDFIISEVTLKTLKQMIHRSYRDDYIEDDEVLEDMGLGFIGDIHSFRNDNLKEKMLATDLSQNDIWAQARKCQSRSLLEEIQRIQEGPTCGHSSKIFGHPVHYIIGGNEDTQRRISDVLIKSLNLANRTQSSRYSVVEAMQFDSQEEWEGIYKNAGGGVVVINFKSERNRLFQRFPSVEEQIQLVLDSASKYRNSVLTIACLPDDDCEKLLRTESKMKFLTIAPDVYDYETACIYLKDKAASNEFSHNDFSTEELDKNKEYKVDELDGILATWHERELRNNVYPQYATLDAMEETGKDEVEDSALKKLESMTGLESAKKVVGDVVSFARMRKVLEENNRQLGQLSLHMAFTGNPGTGKTTVARLLADILREEGIIEGDFIEVGRKDLIAKYVGHTAPRVARAFEKAEGGILFIDEAYSLVDGKQGLFGDEAINTIVQEMENRRDSVIVIFAGYLNEMDKFLSTNPGLRSRIAFHVPFENYSGAEIAQIAKKIAKESGFVLSTAAIKKVQRIAEAESHNPDFGNGRFVRNIVERAYMTHATRMGACGLDKVTYKKLTMLTAEDFEEPRRASTRPIGFAA